MSKKDPLQPGSVCRPPLRTKGAGAAEDRALPRGAVRTPSSPKSQRMLKLVNVVNVSHHLERFEVREVDRWEEEGPVCLVLAAIGRAGRGGRSRRSRRRAEPRLLPARTPTHPFGRSFDQRRKLLSQAKCGYGLLGYPLMRLTGHWSNNRDAALHQFFVPLRRSDSIASRRILSALVGTVGAIVEKSGSDLRSRRRFRGRAIVKK